MATVSHDSSGSGVFEGVPHFVADIFNLNVEAMMKTAATAAVEASNATLQRDIQRSDLWAPWADNVEIVWDGRELGYVFHGTSEERQAMRDLEFGTPEVPPTALVRKHIARLTEQHSKQVESAIAKETGLSEVKR